MATSVRSRSRSTIPAHTGLGISRYDQVAGLLLATLLFFVCLTFVMFLIWLSSQLVRPTPAVPVTVLEDVGGGGSGTGPLSGGLGDLAQPDIGEVAATTEPAIAQALLLAAAVVAERTTEITTLEGDLTPGSGIGRGEGKGIGDGRGPGPGGPGTSAGIPAYDRWEIRMSAASLDEYARQLDYFGIELGVAGGGNPNVEYISKLAAPRPTVRVGNPRDERRLRFLHRSGELRRADRQLAEKAGVGTDGRVVFQFYSDALYQRLLALEAARRGPRRIVEVQRTVFGVKANGALYEIFVQDQQYLGPPAAKKGS
jgi:hypothetical protein